MIVIGLEEVSGRLRDMVSVSVLDCTMDAVVVSSLEPVVGRVRLTLLVQVAVGAREVLAVWTPVAVRVGVRVSGRVLVCEVEGVTRLVCVLVRCLETVLERALVCVFLCVSVIGWL